MPEGPHRCPAPSTRAKQPGRAAASLRESLAAARARSPSLRRPAHYPIFSRARPVPDPTTTCAQLFKLRHYPSPCRPASIRPHLFGICGGGCESGHPPPGRLGSAWTRTPSRPGDGRTFHPAPEVPPAMSWGQDGQEPPAAATRLVPSSSRALRARGGTRPRARS